MNSSATSEVLGLTRELIARRSVTPDDAGCQELIAGRLEAAGFGIETMRFGEVINLWATHGRGGPVLCLAGHTDVVPAGPRDDWTHPPFEPTEGGGRLYGRGACDMKSGLAALIVAAERFVRDHPDHPGTLAFLITADEEGPAKEGTKAVAEALKARGQAIDYCLLGEPTSETRLGDVIKHGRRGSLNGRLRVRGRQGHVAYPDAADNPIHKVLPALADLAATAWDEGDDDFPPTGFQIVSVQGGTGTTNVIPGHLDVLFNFRHGVASPAAELRARTAAVLERHGIQDKVEWDVSGAPFVTAEGPLLEAAREAVTTVCGRGPVLSTGGGTSDGRFLAPLLGTQVLELGPVGNSAHQTDEWVAIADLEPLAAIYQRILDAVLVG